MLRILAILVLLGLAPLHAQRLSALASAPDWQRLEAFQETITREEFVRLLDTVYAPAAAAQGVIEVRESDAVIFKTLAPAETMTLRFTKDAASAKPVPRTWRARKSLAGLRVALDPGHIGGEWALMEERQFARPGDAPLREGELTLRVSQLLAPQLRALGAEVSFVREKNAPSSPFTIDALRKPARQELALMSLAEPFRENYDGPRDPLKMQTVQWQAEKLFYRVAEIRERARLVNTKLKPDLVVCIHFNADDWSDPEAPVFTERNDLHVLIHGCYSAGELRYDDQRFEMLIKLLNRSHAEELARAEPVARALARATKLPPFSYTLGNAVRSGASEFVWARNLLASRIYECPVVFLEPYRMNHAEAYARIQAGDFEGEKEISGRMQRSIFREYADAVAAGLRGE